MAKTTINAYREAAKNLPPECFLGDIVTFTISEADVDLDMMRAELEARGLRTNTLKRRLRRIDAFKKATAEIATKFAKFHDHQNGVLVRSVGQDEAESHRHILFEWGSWKAGRMRSVRTAEIFRIMYDRGVRDKDGNIVNDAIYVDPIPVPDLALTAEEKQWFDEKVGPDGARLRERFEHLSTHLDSHGVRTFVRDYLATLSAVSVKSSGGLYFVPRAYTDELAGLANFIRSIGSEMYLIPLLDIVEGREMIAEALVADTMEEVRQLSVEIEKILSDPKRQITEDTFTEYANKAGNLMARAGDYEKLLGQSLDEATLELKVFKMQTMKLAGRVRQPKSLGSGGAKDGES